MINLFRNSKTGEGWSRASGGTFAELLDFINPHEYKAVTFSSRLINSSGRPDRGKLYRNMVFVERKGDSIVSVVIITPEGTICPVFTEESDVEGLSAEFKLLNCMSRKFLTLMGEAENIIKIEAIFTEKKTVSVDYFLFTALSEKVPDVVKKYLSTKQNSMPQVEIAKATERDLEILMPLRKAYEMEEVLLNPLHFNEESCARRFLATIREAGVFYAILDDKPVSTSCINAYGISWVQIGGVYTAPEYRKMGISAALMGELSKYALSLQRDLTLFVKKTNTAAVKLYSNCGFKNVGNYRITYLESR